MEVVGKQVHAQPSGDVTVEFVGEGGDVVSVHIKHTEDDNLNRANAEERAKVMLLQVATFEHPEENIAVTSRDLVASDDGISPAVKSLELERAQQSEVSVEEQLDSALEDSFPASDPISVVTPTIPGGGPTNGIPNP
jgi:hypothetical protein